MHEGRVRANRCTHIGTYCPAHGCTNSSTICSTIDIANHHSYASAHGGTDCYADDCTHTYTNRRAYGRPHILAHGVTHRSTDSTSHSGADTYPYDYCPYINANCAAHASANAAPLR
jgi:hypothetical protein